MLESLHDEAILVQRAISGDAEAFGGLYTLHLAAIHRYIVARVSDINDAEDLTELVFLKAWEALPRYEQREYRFTSWLYRIAHNVVVDHYRMQKRTISASLLETSDWDSHQPTILDKVIADEERGALAQAVERLPEEQRRVLFLRFVEGLNHAEIARILDKSRGACRIIQHRALSSLNHLLNTMLSVILAILLLLGGTIFASSRALPGSPLYSVKKTVETLQLATASDPAHTTRLHLAFATRRLDEAITLAQQKRIDHVDLVLHDYTTQVNATLPLLDQVPTLSPDERITVAQLLIATQARHADQLMTLQTQVPTAAHTSLDAAFATIQTARDRAQTIIDAEQGTSLSPATPTSTPTTTPTPLPPSPVASPDAAAMVPATPVTAQASSSPLPQFPSVAPPTSALPSTPIPPVVLLPTATATALPSATALPTMVPPMATAQPATATPTIPSPTMTATPQPPTVTPTAVPPTPTRTTTPTARTPTSTITPQTAPFPDDYDDETDPLPTATITPSPTATPDNSGGEDDLLPSPTTTPQTAPGPDNPGNEGGSDDETDLPPPSLPEGSDFPVQSEAGPIRVIQSPSLSMLGPNETLTYTIRLQNNTTTDVSVEVINRLPPVVRYVSGSARPDSIYVPGDLIPGDPMSTDAHILLWSDIAVPAAGETVISFQVTGRAVDEPELAINVVIVVTDGQTFELAPVAIVVLPDR